MTLWEGSQGAPPSWAPLFALQAPLFPPRHIPLHPPPIGFFGSRSPSPSPSVTPPSFKGRAQSGWWGWPSRGFSLGPPSPSFRSASGGRGGGGGGCSGFWERGCQFFSYKILFCSFSNVLSDNLCVFVSQLSLLNSYYRSLLTDVKFWAVFFTQSFSPVFCIWQSCLAVI